jgi:hypothetical protein
VFGGGTTAGWLGDTWTWDGTSWTKLNVTGPSPRQTSLATLNGKILLFGGYDGTVLADTWQWDGASWTQLNVSGPPARYSPAMAGQ